VIPEEVPSSAMPASARSVNNVLVDGMLRATWRLERDGGRRATLVIRPFGALSRAERDDAAAEAHRMLDFAASDADARDVRFAPATG
jgi:hypothetical protein